MMSLLSICEAPYSFSTMLDSMTQFLWFVFVKYCPVPQEIDL